MNHSTLIILTTLLVAQVNDMHAADTHVIDMNDPESYGEVRLGQELSSNDNSLYYGSNTLEQSLLDGEEMDNVAVGTRQVDSSIYRPLESYETCPQSLDDEDRSQMIDDLNAPWTQFDVPYTDMNDGQLIQAATLRKRFRTSHCTLDINELHKQRLKTDHWTEFKDGDEIVSIENMTTAQLLRAQQAQDQYRKNNCVLDITDQAAPTTGWGKTKKVLKFADRAIMKSGLQEAAVIFGLVQTTVGFVNLASTSDLDVRPLVFALNVLIGDPMSQFTPIDAVVPPIAKIPLFVLAAGGATAFDGLREGRELYLKLPLVIASFWSLYRCAAVENSSDIFKLGLRKWPCKKTNLLPATNQDLTAEPLESGTL